MRDARFTLLKALAIILVVLSHAGAPGWLNHFLFIVHVPAFFICAGWFFDTRHLADGRAFVSRRVRRLYLPFVRWSVFFLVVHNLLFPLGLLSETYGNAAGGVTHPYTWAQTAQRLWDIVLGMRGYDPFLCGAFWFFRTLFISSLAFFVLMKLLRRVPRFAADDTAAGWGALGVSLLLTLWQTAGGLTVPGVAQGGYRELTALCFMSAGFLLRRYGAAERLTPRVLLPCLALFVAAGLWFPSCMDARADALRFLRLPLPAVAGFLLLLSVSARIERWGGRLRKGLEYIGDRTLYVFAFHFLAFKAVSAVKVAACSLPWAAVGSHPVVHTPANNALWTSLYLLAGVGLPLAWLALYRRLAARCDFSWGRAGKCAAGFSAVAARGLCVGGLWTARSVSRGVRALCRGAVSSVRSFVRGVKEILAASSPKDE